MELNSIISSFDTEHADDDNFLPAVDHCKDFRFCLWTVAISEVGAIGCAPDPNNNELVTYQKNTTMIESHR